MSFLCEQRCAVVADTVISLHGRTELGGEHGARTVYELRLNGRTVARQAIGPLPRTSSMDGRIKKPSGQQIEIRLLIRRRWFGLLGSRCVLLVDGQAVPFPKRSEDQIRRMILATTGKVDPLESALRLARRFRSIEELLAGGEIEQAEIKLKWYLLDDPNNALALDMLIGCLAERKAWEDALRYADRLMGVYPQESHGHLMRAVILKNLHRFPDAVVSAQQALNREPDNLHALSLRAECLLELDRPEEAFRTARRALELDSRCGPCGVVADSALERLQQRGENDTADRLAAAAGYRAYRGWKALEGRDYRAAVERFTEAHDTRARLSEAEHVGAAVALSRVRPSHWPGLLLLNLPLRWPRAALTIALTYLVVLLAALVGRVVAELTGDDATVVNFVLAGLSIFTLMALPVFCVSCWPLWLSRLGRILLRRHRYAAWLSAFMPLLLAVIASTWLVARWTDSEALTIGFCLAWFWLPLPMVVAVQAKAAWQRWAALAAMLVAIALLPLAVVVYYQQGAQGYWTVYTICYLLATAGTAALPVVGLRGASAADILRSSGTALRNLLAFVAIYLILFVGALTALRLIYYGMVVWGAAIGVITLMTAVMLSLVSKVATVREEHRRQRRRRVAEARRQMAETVAARK